MTSEKLLALLNDSYQPSEILSKLNEENFQVTDLTAEGDSILHVLAKSKHTKSSSFFDYAELLIQAGAPVNALDKQGNSFLTYYLKRVLLSYYIEKIFDLLLNNPNFDFQQPFQADQTFFELMYNLNDYTIVNSFKKLIEHKNFNPNQATSKHNSILLHMLSEPAYAYKDCLFQVIKNPKTNPNIKNNNGQTALAQILSSTEYKDMELIKELINTDQFDVNTLDKDGNNYLQLVIIHCQYLAEEIATLLIEKGIDISHTNYAGKSAIDLIDDNLAGRSDYGNLLLFLKILKLQPTLFFTKKPNDKTILGELLKSTDYSVTSQFNDFFKLCKKQTENRELLKSIISECFNDFRKNHIAKTSIITLTEALLKANIEIDIEYCLACLAIGKDFYERNETYANLKKLALNLDVNTIIKHVKNLTIENSDEQLQAINFVRGATFNLDCFDEEILAWEESHLQTKSNSDLNKDCKMFGHLFSLSGAVTNSNAIKLTGSHFSDTAPFLTHLMNAYVKDCEQKGKYTVHQDVIKQVRNMTLKAMRFYLLSTPWNYYPSMEFSNEDLWAAILADSKTCGAEIITGWSGHAIDLIIHQDNLYRNNGGGCSTDITTEHYKITKPQNLSAEVLTKLFKESRLESNKPYIQHDLHTLLGLVFNQSIAGKFQTVGNCSLASMLIALKVKYRLFLPADIADELYLDTITFFEQFYLEEFLSRYADNPILPHLLMRLIIQKLLPEKKLELAGKLLQDYFTTDASQEIMQAELMLYQWKKRVKGNSLTQFDKQLQSLGIVLKPNLNPRLLLLNHFLTDTVTSDDLEELKSWSLDKQIIQGYSLLHFAVMNNNLALATSLIQLFPQTVNHTNWFDEEPLCLVKSVEMIDLLIKAGASIARTEYDNALDYAIKANRVDLVEALLKRGAKTSEYSATYAASKDPKILQLLIDFYPTIVTKPTHNYSSAIHAAAKNGHNTNLRNLVYYGGANPDACDVNGVTPLQLALRNEHPDTAKLLIQYPGTLFKAPYRGDLIVNMTKDSDIKQLLELKEKERQDDLVYFEKFNKQLIELKEKERQDDLTYFEKFKNSKLGIINEEIDYLIVAIRLNDIRAIRGCLLTYPTLKVVNSSSLYCTTPLTEAIRLLAGKKGKDHEEAFEIVNMLFKMPGININALMASSEPLLFMATSIGDVAVLDLFLADPKLDPNKQDNMGYTALHDAVERGHLACVKRLLQDPRVDTTIVNNANETVLDLNSSKPSVRECQEEVALHQQQTHRQTNLAM
ncbi:ankyrin repeat domain-containing protein [Legionella sp. D16C41]|uniref:ankyrin repeat domain-containing protein n=1 Tax=Legionella sp. D16C41 TaxID=3402688 RepID=UPI003AF6E0FF